MADTTVSNINEGKSNLITKTGKMPHIEALEYRFNKWVSLKLWQSGKNTKRHSETQS